MLRIRLQLQRAKDAGDPFAFCPEPQQYILPTDGGGSPSARFAWTEQLLADLEAIRQPGRDPELLRRVGETLRRFLHEGGWAETEREITGALAAGRRVHLSIRSSAAELYSLPWPLLLLGKRQAAGEEDGLLLRYEWPDSESAAERPTPRREGGRILVAWSAAGGRVPASEHIAAIAGACRAGRYPFDPVADVLPQTSLAGIAERLEAAQRAGTQVAVLHLLCHGGKVGSGFGLCLDGQGGSVVVDAAQVRKQLAPFAHMVRLVVLSACDSGHPGPLGSRLGGVAQQLHYGGFQSVIASRYPLSVAGSIQLTETLYERLLPGLCSLEDAFLAVRKRLSRDETGLPREQQRLDWASLQLYARQEDGDDTRPLLFRPYRGLLAFEPEHSRFFFGRDPEVQEICRDLQALSEASKPRFLVVAGASGTGKSSLLLAGALPKILQRDPQLCFLRMRPGGDPNAALARVLLDRRVDSPALIFVDQFEEIFTQTGDAALRQTFVRKLWALAADPGSQVSIVVTLRVDFLGRCGELALDDTGLRLDQIAYAEAHRVFIAQLRPEQLRAAIVKPAELVGLWLQEGLVERMLEDVGGEPGALPLLQDALDVLWLNRSGDTLPQSAYLAMGGVVGALQQRADELLASLSAAEQVIAQRLLIGLVSVSEDTALDTRLVAPVDELRQMAAPSDVAGFEHVLAAFVRERLLVQGGDAGSATVEVAHEALIRKWPRLRAWLDEGRAGLLIQRRIKQAAQQWAAQNGDEALLYRGSQLAQASEWRKTWAGQLGEPVQRFLDASEAWKRKEDELAVERQRQEQARARQARLAAVVLGVLFIAALVASGVAIVNGIFAKENAEAAQRSAARSHSALLLALAQNENDDPTTVAELLREAYEPYSSLWIQAAVRVLQNEIAETVLRGHAGDVRAVAFSRDGKKIATASGDRTVGIWNVDRLDQPVYRFSHSESVYSVAFSPDGKTLVMGSADRKARIFRVTGGEPLAVLSGHQADILAVAFSPDGKKVVTGSADTTARIWNADGRGEPIILAGHQAAVTSVAFDPSGAKILTGSLDHTARLWRLADPGNPLVFQGHQGDVTSVAFSPDGTRILTGSLDNTARLWSEAGPGEPLVLRGHSAYVIAVAFSPDGSKVVTGSSDKTVRSWSVDGLTPPLVYRGHAAYVSSVAYSPDGKRILSGSGDQTARIWHAEDVRPSVLCHQSPSAVRAVAASPDGSQIASGHEDGRIRIWQVGSPKPPRLLPGHPSAVTSVAYSPDGRKLASGGMDQTVRIWLAQGEGEPLVLREHQGAVSAVAFSPDGSKLASASQDQTLRLFASDGSGQPLVLRGHQAFVNGVAFRPDGKSLISGSSDRTVRLWNADGSGTPQLFRGHDGPVNAVALSADGNLIVSGSSDRTVRMQPTLEDVGPQVLRGHESYVNAVAYSSPLSAAASASEDGTVRLWRFSRALAPLLFQGHLAGVTTVAFSKDGEKLISGGRDGSVRLWLTNSHQMLQLLWKATSDCLPDEQRQQLLGEDPREAWDYRQACLREVARRRSAATAGSR